MILQNKDIMIHTTVTPQLSSSYNWLIVGQISNGWSLGWSWKLEQSREHSHDPSGLPGGRVLGQESLRVREVTLGKQGYR
jgi:hypothetical protein